jgi:hypothetical protein
MGKQAKRGRPSKYKPEYCEQIIAHMAQGFSFESFAGAISVDRDSLYEWVKRFPAFSDAKKLAFAKCLLHFEMLGKAAMEGQDIIDKATGKVIIQGKKIHPTLWIYQMKCRFRDQWSETVRVESDDKGPVMLAYARNRNNKGKRQ